MITIIAWELKLIILAENTINYRVVWYFHKYIKVDFSQR